MMQGKTVLITGGTAGIGLAAAQELASIGAKLILVGRDEVRGAAALSSLAGAEGRHRMLPADLSLVGEVRRLANVLRDSEPHIDVLANNAGTWFRRRELTAEGVEHTFAVNHLAYVMLTLELENLLLAAERPRVINTGSFMYRQARYDPENLMAERKFGTNRTYAATKLYNLMATRALASAWSNTPIRLNCFSPGFVATAFGRGEGGMMEPYYRFIRLFAAPAQSGARTLVHLASSEDAATLTGAYLEKGKVRLVRGPAADAALCSDLLRRTREIGNMAGINAATIRR